MDNNDVRLLRTFWNCEESLSCDQYAACFVDMDGSLTVQAPKALLTQEEQRIKEHLKRIKNAMPVDVGNGVVEVRFTEPCRTFLDEILDSRLKNEEAMEELYQVIAENVDHNSPIEILVYHAFVDMPHKASDGARLEDSEEVYEHIICIVCETKMQKKELALIGESEALTIPDRVIKKPITGFVWPLLSDLSGEDNAIMVYNSDTRKPCHMLYEKGLGTTRYRTMDELRESMVEILKENTICEYEFMKRLDDIAPEETLTSDIFALILMDMGKSDTVREKAIENYREKVGRFSPTAGDLVIRSILDETVKVSERERIRKLLQKAAAVIETAEGNKSELARSLKIEADKI